MDLLSTLIGIYIAKVETLVLVKAIRYLINTERSMAYSYKLSLCRCKIGIT